MTPTLNIGLVEDNDDDAANFSRAFAEIGSVQRWASGEALLADLAEDDRQVERLDLLLLDVNLPGADGVSLLGQIRAAKAGRDVKVVMLTGSFAEHDILRSLEASADEYEVKPSDLADLRALVTRCAALVAGTGDSAS